MSALRHGAGATPSGYRELLREPACRVAVLQHVVLSSWREPPTGPRIEALNRGLRTLLSEPDPIGGLHLLRFTTMPSFDDALRQSIEGVYRTTVGRRGAVAMVFAVEGFGAAALRALFAGAALVVRNGLAQKIFTDERSAGAWLLERVARPGAGPTLPALLDAVAELERG